MASTLSEKAYLEIRERIVRLDLAPGTVIREDDLRAELGIGRTPIREALQRLVRDEFVTVLPRRGMLVSAVEVAELSTLFETRIILEPYAARLAAARGTERHWRAMGDALDSVSAGDADSDDLMAVDTRCHAIVWEAAGNRFLLSTLGMLYAHSNRLWHMYLAEVDDMRGAVAEHAAIHRALVAGDADTASRLTEEHVSAFNSEITRAVRRRLRLGA